MAMLIIIRRLGLAIDNDNNNNNNNDTEDENITFILLLGGDTRFFDIV